MSRKSGILLHPTSLPSPYGVGDFGDEAYRFVDFLVDSGQKIWQMLPLGATGYGNSPYQTHSAFAGNHILISPDRLIDDGLLNESDIEPLEFEEHRVDYDRVIPYKYDILRVAYKNFLNDIGHPHHSGFEKFKRDEAHWLDEFVLFFAIKHLHDDQPWHRWQKPIRDRDPKALQEYRDRLSSELEFYSFIQFIFYHQFEQLHRYATQRGVELIGDIPIFVAHDSSDVWSHPEWFLLDSSGEPTVVAGVPPDYFSKSGQRWGNPLYDWESMSRDGYSFWVDRFAHTLKNFDTIRIDHFRGFASYWEIPAEDETAIGGRWVDGVGIELFRAISSKLGDNISIIAEDLGIVGDDVVELLKLTGFPNMAVLQFGFESMDSSDPSSFLPHNLKENQVVYTGTHDNSTILGWWHKQPKEVQEFTKTYINTDAKVIHRDMIRIALGSVSQRAIFPMQDLLALGAEADMNHPGTTSGNWEWRMKSNDMSQNLAKDLAFLCRIYGR
ncbi:4-alpha-glucanotransferase (amylomaltase) [hydrothermal vent metagenome]|uniref:4-alpha-glucanotransferase n=1 Tax=hydrothermal vent metagenome TaxID=652676 RepID=A0A1W1C4Z8_9ZZZZ